MKNILLLLSFFLVNELVVLGQDKGKGVNSAILRFSLSCPDSSNNSVFAANGEIKEILVSYYNYEPLVVKVYFDDFGTKNPKTEFYDLSFSGDSCYLVHKYGSLVLKVPRFRLDYIYNQKENYNTVDRVTGRIKKDSIFYHFSHWRLSPDPPQANRNIGIGGPAKPKFSINLLEEKLSKELAHLPTSDPIDSTVVFKAEITEKGQLRDLELIVGRKSSFSEAVESELQKRANSWSPASIRSAIKSYVRIFAQLNKDGSVRLETPRTLGTFTGE